MMQLINLSPSACLKGSQQINRFLLADTCEKSSFALEILPK